MEESGEVAELVVKEGIELSGEAVKLAGQGVVSAAALVAALASDQNRVVGRASVTRLARENSEILVVPIRAEDLKTFDKQAKRYGILYAAVTEITSNPDAYGRYLNMQGDNPGYSPGNIAMVMFQQPEFTKFCTAERWKNLGRSVMESQKGNGAKLFARATFGRGYTLTDAYDISQTQGRALVSTMPLENDSAEMSKALTTLLNYSVVPIVADRGLSEPARYNAGKLELYINPAHEDTTLFSAIAAEIAHVGYNTAAGAR